MKKPFIIMLAFHSLPRYNLPMPHEFPTVGHGAVPFGFFNINTDLLWLQKRFFFADDFCAAVRTLAAAGESSGAALPCWRVDHPAMIGDLNGAIRGDYHKGFIGAVYARWPFPKRKADFTQDPDGYQTREEVADLIKHVGVEEKLTVRWNHKVVTLGTVAVALPDFGAMLRHLEQGPPPWREGRLPDYLAETLQTLKEQDSPLLG